MTGRSSGEAEAKGAFGAEAAGAEPGRGSLPRPQASAAAATRGSAFLAMMRMGETRELKEPPMPILASDALTRTYVSGGREISVLKNITFNLPPGGFLAIVGPSGSGKSTLLGLLAGLDRPTSGRVFLDGRDLTALTEDQRARLRAERVGFVFQSFHLIPTLTARENIQVPLELRGEDGRARADELLARVGLEDRGHHYPAQLSGGEQQRVALARAFCHRPRILFADEPTGNLDAANGQMVVGLMAELNHELGTTVVLVTHDHELASRARRVIRLRDGAIVGDSAPPHVGGGEC